MTESTEDKTHVIDPDGEVTFLLEDANAPFAVWDEKKINQPTPEKPVEKPPKEKIKVDESKEYIRIRVSAKHLMLASPVLKKTLSGGWKESELFAKTGSIELVIQEWDLEAFLLFMRIIHCQHRNLPSKITLEMLAKIAVLADYYACPDTVTFFANLWIDQLKSGFPTRYTRDLILWMFVSWYFNKKEESDKAISIAMTQSNAPITNLDLPLPTTFLDDLNRRRENKIQHVISQLKRQQDLFLSDDWYCSFECCSMLLGALQKQMHMNGLSLPGPEAPFIGIDYKTLVTTVHAFRIPQWGIRGGSNNYRVHSCDETIRGYNYLKFETFLK